MQCSSQKPVVDIDKRRKELLELSSYIHTVENDVTMILQSLQWDRNHLIEATPTTSCRYDQNHRVPPDKLKDHEKGCYLKSLGYSKEDLLLPEPFDSNSNTLVTLNKNDIENIIDYAANIDPSFKKGKPDRNTTILVVQNCNWWSSLQHILVAGYLRGGEQWPPLSLERLQHAYSTDERRALHDAAVSAAPSCHDLNELALLGGEGDAQSSKRKSRAEILGELRDMKRRRAKYRGAAKTRNYSDVLRDVIDTQMEHYTEARNANAKNNSQNVNNSKSEAPKEYRNVCVKKEPCEPDNTNAYKYADKETRRNYSKEHERYQEKSKEELRHRQNYRDETRHSDRSRHSCKEREKYDNSKRNRDDRRHVDDSGRYSSSSKERRRDKKEYRDSEGYNYDSRGDQRCSGKYRDDSRRKDHKDYKSSRNSEAKYKHEYDSHEKSHREEKHKRYYDYGQEYEVSKKRIKQERD